jgi:hypothetical protein
VITNGFRVCVVLAFVFGVWISITHNTFCANTNGHLAADGAKCISASKTNLYLLELIQTQMAQKPMLRAEVGMRVRCANKASAE